MEPILNAPVILDLGKASRKNVRQLKAGGGKLLADVQEAMAQVTSSLGEQAQGKQLVPVVLLYRRKARRRKGGGGLIPIFS
jgi:hypothetical protein